MEVNMKHLTICSVVILSIACLVASCGPSPAQIELAVLKTQSALPTQTAYPTLTAYPTFTDYPTLTPYPTYTPLPTIPVVVETVIVTETFTPTPLMTATITPTPTITLIPSRTTIPSRNLSPLQMLHHPGIYLINVDIASGVWRSLGKSDSCYWKVSTKTGGIIANHFGMAGGTMYLAPTAFQAEMSAECGDWEYLGE
jgi:hypothetical protein